MRIHKYLLPLEEIPVDLFADPDGNWTYESLVTAAGFDPDATPPPLVGALAEPWAGHPDGTAVVAAAQEGGAYVAIVACDVPGEATVHRVHETALREPASVYEPDRPAIERAA